MTDHASLAEPTFSAGSARAILDALGRLGHDTSLLLEPAGLRADDLDDPDARIFCAAIERLLASAQRRRPIANLELRLAMETPLGAYPLLDYLIVTSATVGAGMRRFAQHPQLCGAPLRIELHEDETPIRMVMEGAAYSVFLTALHLRREGDAVPEYVSLRVAPDDPAATEATLGCPVRIGAPWSGLAMSRRTWRLPLRRRDPALQGLLERHAAEVVARLPKGTDAASEVRRVLAQRIASGDVRLAAVARVLGTSARTLQRRLEAAGSSYQEVLEHSRCDLAERHLAENSLSIGEISWLVGYSEPSAFQRAFKRWRGQSPSAFRDAMRGTR